MDNPGLNVFFERIITTFENHFKENHNKPFTTQTAGSCRAIYDLCFSYNPDCVVEIGTNHGASTVSILTALRDLNKEVPFTSIDLSHKAWEEVGEVQGSLVSDLSWKSVRTITGDFNKVNVEDISLDKKLFLFYDMHDHTGPWSLRLLNDWIPRIHEGMIAMHDFSRVDDSYVVKSTDIQPKTKIKYMNGQIYAGFLEVHQVISWANSKRVLINNFDGGVYYNIEKGLPEVVE